MKHVLQIGQQLLRRIKALHSIDYVHGDIKPANIMFGRGDKRNTLYLIDFGMTKKESNAFDNHIDESIYEKKNLDFSVIVRQNMLPKFIRYYW
jgi:serine/threonine protein kinase